MKQVEQTINHAEQQCKSRGARLTDKRKRILSSLLIADKAMSAYELVDFCKAEFDETIPAMSVYRILDFLQEEQLVHKLNLANKYVACSHITCQHSHEVPQFLICAKCQKVKEVSLGKITQEELKHNVEDAGFQLLSPQLEINCVCSDCVGKAA